MKKKPAIPTQKDFFPQPSAITKESKDLFKLLVENSTDLITILNTDGKILYASPSCKKFLGYTQKELIGKNAFALIHPDDLPIVSAEIGSNTTGGYGSVATFRVKDKKGRWIFVEGSGSVIFNEDKKPSLVISVSRDITQRVHLEAALRKSKEQLEVILENIADGISLQDATGEVIYINEVGARLSGYKTTAEALSDLQFIMQQEPMLGKFEIRDEESKPLPIENLPGQKALRGEKSPQAVVEYYNSKDQTHHWSLVKSRPIQDDDGNIQGAVNIFSDITKQIELEKRKDEFISMASHELKTPLTSLKVYTQLLQKQLAKESISNIYISKMNKQIDKLTQLISELLDISRIQQGKLEYHNELFNMEQLVKEVVDTIKPTAQQYSIVIKSSPTVVVNADRDRLGQVIINLLTNAIKYSPVNRKIIVQVKELDGHAIVGVKDFGIGITKEDQSKIFQRFYQVGEQNELTYPGLGIGLFISNEIIKRHNGKFWVDSIKGKGSTFYFSLPIYEKK